MTAHDDAFAIVLTFASMFGVLLALALQRGLGGVLDGNVAVDPNVTPRLALGDLPDVEGALALAGFHGPSRLADTLAAAAVADGWLMPEGARSWRVVVDARPHPQLAVLHDELSRRGAGPSSAMGGPVSDGDVRAATRTTAVRLARERSYDALFHKLGFVREGSARVFVGVIPFLFVFAIVLAVLLRERVNSGLATTLLVTNAPFFVMYIVLGLVRQPTTRYRRTISWLWEHTWALHADVMSGIRRRVDDVSIAVAVHGLGGCRTAELTSMNALWSLHREPKPTGGRPIK